VKAWSRLFVFFEIIVAPDATIGGKEPTKKNI
jgi:hypothetical protein